MMMMMIIIIPFSAIIRELGLDDKVTVEQIAKKWENLKLKYKVGLQFQQIARIVPNLFALSRDKTNKQIFLLFSGNKISTSWNGGNRKVLSVEMV